MTAPETRRSTRPRIPSPRSGTVKLAGLVGAAVGVAAAGVAAGIAAERAVVRRSKAGADPYVDEVFGDQPYDEECTIEMPDGTDLHVEIVRPTATGPGRPTLVFVHGFCLDMGTFHFQRTALAARGEHRMVFYDQPGHGRSGQLETGEYDLGRLGEALRSVVDRTVPDGPLVLVGHSMGGMTIMAFAERYPEMFGDRVVGTVLISTSAGRLRQARFGLPAVLARAGGPLLPLIDNATRLTGGVVDQARKASSNVAWLLTRRYGFGTTRPSPALVSYVEEMNSHTSAETVARYLRTLYAHSRYPALAALSGVPTLVIVGDKDVITPVSHSEEIVRRLPEAEYVKVPDSGHVVMLEHADVVNEAIVDWLGKAARMTPTITLPTVDDTYGFGQRLAAVLRPGDLLVLTGPLGAGKTALVRGIGAGLRVLGDVTSPTFVIARVHRPDAARGGRVALVHADAYRLGDAADPRAEIDDLDLDASMDDSVTVVEWGEGMVEQLGDAHLRVRIDRRDDDTRIVELEPVGGDWSVRIASLS